MTEAELLSRSADEVLQVMERHRRLLLSLKKGGDARLETCLITDCPHRRKLKGTIIEVIEILERTRKAFKSRQLELLRKKLIGVLAEDA